MPERALALVREQLKDGPRPESAVRAAARAAAISEDLLIVATDVLGVRSRRGQWRLPGYRLELSLSEDQEKMVREGAALYKAVYLDTIDSVFKIAKAIEVLRGANYGTEVQGGFAEALMQYGFTNRDGDPIDKGTRSNFRALLDNESEVRTWWKGVLECQKRDWVSVRAIFRHWQASKNPKTARWPTTWPNRKTPVEPVVEAWVLKPKPLAAAIEAKQRVETEAEAARLAAEEPAASGQEIERDRARITELEEELASARARQAESPIDASGPREIDSPADLVARMADLVTRIERLHADLVMSKNWPAGISQAKTKRLLSGLRKSFTNHMALRDAFTPAPVQTAASPPEPPPGNGECPPKPPRRRGPTPEIAEFARAFLRAQLADGPRPEAYVLAAAEAASIPERWLIAAASELEVRTQRGHWWLPG